MSASSSQLAAIALGGACGALARYGISGWAVSHWGVGFPWGTLLINVSGSFALGLVNGLAAGAQLPGWVPSGVSVGFLGAYTTFSTFELEAYQLTSESNKALSALAYVCGSVVSGFVACGLGIALGKMLIKSSS